jgi:predicted ATPase with chaperone activity
MFERDVLETLRQPLEERTITLSRNAQMGVREVRLYCQLEQNAQRLLEQAIDHLNLSARAYHRVLKVARTIADLEQSEMIKAAHVAEAIQYRSSEEHILEGGM